MLATVTISNIVGNDYIQYFAQYDDYLVKHYNNGVRPHCAVCKNETRFISKNRSFKKYCIEHANQSRADWSKQNGYGANQDAGWKRGLTKENNDVIKKHSEWMTGENNPMHKNNPRNRNENDD